MSENSITKNYIRDVFEKLSVEGLVEFSEKDFNGTPFVRRLKNLQHICQTINAKLTISTDVTGKF